MAGIVIHAAGSELTVEHPTDPATLGAALLILGGPALFLLGHAVSAWEVRSERHSPL